MHILIDKNQWRMVAAAATRKWANLAKYVDYHDFDIIVVDGQEQRTWTTIGEVEMQELYSNMSGQQAPEYGECIRQLSAYAETWPQYPKDEAQLEREAEAIYRAEEAAKSDEDRVADAKRALERQREAHQAAIDAAATSKAAEVKAQPGEPSQPAPTKPKAKAQDGTPPERPRQGITKRIWEIADELLAVTGKIGNLKEFRKQVIDRASAEGANAGTAATQFGKWKAARDAAS